MRKTIITSMMLCLSTTITWAEQVVMETKSISMVLDVVKGSQPKYVYFGAKLSAKELQNIQAPVEGRMDAYPAYGLNTPAEAAIAMRHSDGNLSTALVVEGIQRSGNTTTILLKDPVYPIAVNLKYKVYQEEDMIEAWTEITNNEKQTVTLTTFASAMLPTHRGDVCHHLIHTLLVDIEIDAFPGVQQDFAFLVAVGQHVLTSPFVEIA